MGKVDKDEVDKDKADMIFVKTFTWPMFWGQTIYAKSL